MTFRKILVALDQSFQDTAIFRRALEQSKPHISSMMLVHTVRVENTTRRSTTDPGSLVDPSPQQFPHAEDALDMYETLRRRQERHLNQELCKARDWIALYIEQAMAKGIPAQGDCRIHEPGLHLCTVAKTWGADLIVLGHREVQGLRNQSNDSVSHYVMQHAPCSVLIVNAMSTPERTHAQLDLSRRDDTAPKVEAHSELLHH
jgi:nucleotide-binding universal stress UspA family protein